jgi:hypothetical protein
MTVIKVPFGLRDGRLFDPSQVENGKRCGCDCPGCHRPLIARQHVQTPHFAHAPGKDCSSGYETAIHLAAKQLISERMEIALPPLDWRSPPGWGAREGLPQRLANSLLVKLSNVRVEHWMDGIRPDIVATHNGRDLLVEIAVTHFVEPEKRSKIEARGIPAIELDISESKEAIGFSTLERLLFSVPSTGEWIYHPELADRTKKELAEREKMYERVQKARIEEEERVHQYRKLSPEHKVRRHLNKTGMAMDQLKKLTCFVPGEDSYVGGRLAWQSAVLAYIENTHQQTLKLRDVPGYVDSEALKYWLQKVFDIAPRFVGAEGVAVWKYLEHLEKLGILRRIVSASRNFEVKMRPIDAT